ncbi:hypothetical protein N7450_011566 [Penicillium hetheringtonii]|uniref:Uncharacterized protein n=1 Tax=Penicillium hetheringtonii TaxID=911720 RepID=A0AAD6DAA5_9EURO|nr:hypothetical protein N7450_011566 [Penicillium hetheringtonii]
MPSTSPATLADFVPARKPRAAAAGKTLSADMIHPWYRMSIAAFNKKAKSSINDDYEITVASEAASTEATQIELQSKR